ncbi:MULTISPECIES: HEAT repeat domain-containing protein [unclassified Coleofasciculus]|uniref:HEAT repeat domain-containing protein n=1 Tax=unclassified Coleofasciculus TaxID=2692782 RepID=UPI00187ECD4E|nr:MULTISPECIES: HEAT repeat domain-containing protein [unclassified Coleofasciculus]MBE9129063.1 HEAT repeat domain-containing protein [Coleofasciculus sp. LEGE 07081]MBE9152130.1 HEAT repeat domain-containing protein [Coleofasciculus sp. LEGE 07092]
MSKTLEQAKTAAQQGNWSLLNQCLQRLHGDRKSTESQLPDESNQQQVLDLALQVIEAGDFQERWEVAKLFPSIGQPAIAPLIELLQDEDADPEARWFAGRILGEFNEPMVVVSLVQLLQVSEDEDLAQIAAQALANMGSSAIEALSRLLAEEELRALAVQALFHIRRPETIAPLLSVVDDPLPTIRATAIEALSSFHDSRIPPILVAALKDKAALVRKVAVIGLGLRAHQLTHLDLVNCLKPLLYDLNGDVCQQAAIALGRLGTDDASEALFRVLKSPATPVELKLELVRALSWSETAKALDYLQEGLRWAPELVCQEIVTVLGRVESAPLKPKATQILINFLHSGQQAIQQTRIRQAIALSLGQLGDEQAIEVLSKLTGDSEHTVRLHAIAALKKFPNEDQQ